MLTQGGEEREAVWFLLVPTEFRLTAVESLPRRFSPHSAPSRLYVDESSSPV